MDRFSLGKGLSLWWTQQAIELIYQACAGDERQQCLEGAAAASERDGFLDQGQDVLDIDPDPDGQIILESGVAAVEVASTAGSGFSVEGESTSGSFARDPNTADICRRWAAIRGLFAQRFTGRFGSLELVRPGAGSGVR